MSGVNKSSSVSLTEGVIWKKLLLFALPLLGSSFIQQLYTTVDLIFVGNFVGKEASASVGASALVVTCMVGFFSGLSVGSGVVTAKFFGGRNKEKLRTSVHTSIGISLAGGTVLTIIGYMGAPYFLHWMNTPGEIMPMAISYLRIYFFSLISIITYNMGAGVVRALGDSKSPMNIQLIGGLLNIILNAVFVLWFGMGIRGSAWATVIAQGIACVLILVKMMRLQDDYRLQFKNIGIDKKLFIQILQVGVPAGIQSLVITLSNIFAQYHINGFNVDAIAAFTAYFKVELLIYLPIMAFGQAITTFSGQNTGAGNIERLKRGTRVCVFMGIGVTILLSTLLLIFGEYAFGIFNQDSEVIKYGMRIISTSFPFYWIYVILEVLGSSVRGAGKALPPMIIIITNICVLRTLLLFIIMGVYHDVRGVAVTYPITWAVTAICMFIYYKKGRWT